MDPGRPGRQPLDLPVAIMQRRDHYARHLPPPIAQAHARRAAKNESSLGASHGISVPRRCCSPAPRLRLAANVVESWPFDRLSGKQGAPHLR